MALWSAIENLKGCIAVLVGSTLSFFGRTLKCSSRSAFKVLLLQIDYGESARSPARCSRSPQGGVGKR